MATDWIYQVRVPACTTIVQEMGNGRLNFNNHNFSDVNGVREGSTATFFLQGNKEDWFHIPFTTPAFIGTSRATILQAIALFSFPVTAVLDRVQVWDGQKLVFDKQTGVTGIHNAQVDTYNSWDVNSEPIYWGTTISLHVSATQDTTIFFNGAGIDYLHQF